MAKGTLRRAAARLLAVTLCLATPFARAESTPVLSDAWETKLVRSYSGETLQYTIERFLLDGATCYLTRIVMEDPGRQIGKAQANWKKDTLYPSDIAKRAKNRPRLVINGSGYVSPAYPGIPDNYPGVPRDYFYTPLGTLTITDGELLRDLDLPYYGLTLQKDGLHLHVGEETADVLAQGPTQTWSFYVKCPLIQDGEVILDTEWEWANRRALRNIIMKIDEHTYDDLIVTGRTGSGLTLVRCTEFIQEVLRPQWAYNLDGGPSAALLAPKSGDETVLRTVYGNNSKDFDIMTFSELADVKE